MQKLSSCPKTGKWPNLPDTRKLHSLINMSNQNIMNICHFLCCCDPCMHDGSECLNNVCPSSWEAYNFSRKCKVKTNLTQWIEASDSHNENTFTDIHKSTEVVSAQFDWEKVMNSLSRLENFTDLRNFVQTNPLPPLKCMLHTQMTESAKRNLDFVALHYLPKDAPDSYAPYKIVGDGNCFPRSVNYLVFGTQDRHIEIRVWLVYKAVINKELYLDNNYLCRGANHEYHQGTLAEQFAQYSDNWTPPANLNVDNIYEKEVLDICKINTFMGIWQMFQTANLVGHPIKPVYPENTKRNIRLDINRYIWCFDNTLNHKEILNLMWTPMQVANTFPCHFVPLLKLVRYF